MARQRLFQLFALVLSVLLFQVESGVCRKKQLMTIMPNNVPVRVEEIFIDTQEVSYDVITPLHNF
jgi:translation elongation factor EF-1alpha